MSKLIFVISLFLTSLLIPGKAYAAKARVWAPATKATVMTATRPTFSVKLRKDRRAITVNFFNISLANSISYELTYMGNDIEQGVVGSVYQTEGSSAFRELLFGTCSHNVCTYHKNIQNTQLTIKSKLKSGKTLTSRYKIKV